MMKIIATVLTLLFCSNAQSQDCVESTAYQLTLKTLLSHSVPEICADAVNQSDSNIVFLDAREVEETNVSGLKNSIPVGYDNFNLKTVKNIPKNSKIIVYCSVGYRSEKVAEKLIKAGYTDVSNLYGGIFEWVNKGNYTYKNDTITTKIHAYNKAWGLWVTKGEKVYQ